MMRAISSTMALVLLAVAGVCAAEPVRTLNHAFGTTRVEGTPLRVVTLYQGANDTAVALGIEPVGVVDSWVEKPMYRYLREPLSEAAHLGLETQPNLEGIAWLQPDLIVATRYRHEQIRHLLARIAPTVAQRTAYGFKETLRLMGRATGREARARELLADWQRRVAAFRNRARCALGEDWPQEAAVVGFKSDHARIYYSGFAGSILEELGFRRPQAHQGGGWGVKLTNQESIPAMNAEVMFVFMNDDDPAVVENFRRWQAHPLWRTLDAVDNDRVYHVDNVTWSMGAGILAANAVLDDLFEIYGLREGGRGC
ncbi:ABC transporter substrate-binding protein [Arhodomonas sp. AD133]|uniref:ABC transporter substrate-binding protein n=1 Tax=Arhodomonas sp. AD133 TaxID=3415009 RepID=UPI003EB6DB33